MLTLQKTILVIGKDRVSNLKISLLLKRLDYNVFVASGGNNFLGMTGGVMPDLMILDLCAPVFDGQACLEKIRKGLGMVKVLIVSDRAEDALLADGSGAGDAFLQSPFSPAGLYSSVQRLTEVRPRETPRIKVILKATIFSGNNGRSPFATALSERGVFIRTMNLLPTGSSLKLALDLPSSRRIILEGEVIYHVKYNRRQFFEPGMGILFKNLEGEVRQDLKRFIEESLAGDLDDEMLISG